MQRNIDNIASNTLPSRRYVNIALLCVLLAYIAPKLASFHRYSHVDYKPHARIQWSQPAALDGEFSNPVTNKKWRFEFDNIERLLWASKASPEGDLTINPELLKLLDRTTALIPRDIDTEERSRLSLLIGKSLPGKPGEQLATLLSQYQRYQIDLQSSLHAINQANVGDKLELVRTSLASLTQRQDQYFGEEVAKRLFGKKNITTRYLIQRRIISMSKELTNVEKNQRFDELKVAYKATISSPTDD